MSYNLPNLKVQIDDPIANLKQSFSAQDLDSVVGFFLKYQFDIDNARAIAVIILNQARLEQKNVYEFIEKLSGLTELQLNYFVLQILNDSRSKTSLLGMKSQALYDDFEVRNILV